MMTWFTGKQDWSHWSDLVLVVRIGLTGQIWSLWSGLVSLVRIGLGDQIWSHWSDLVTMVSHNKE